MAASDLTPRASEPGDHGRRLVYVVLAVVTIGIGLAVHLHGTALTPTSRDVLGDALWAAMIAWWVGALAPRATLALRGGAVYMICAAVEISQAYHAPALDAIRATTPGQLVLGSGFDPRDFVAYALGVGGAVLMEIVARRPR